MVCVPCFIIPVLLYIWHRFIQPILLRYWNPWEKKDAQGNIIKAGPEFPFECKGGVCPYQGAKSKGLEEETKQSDGLTETAETVETKTAAITTSVDDSKKDK